MDLLLVKAYIAFYHTDLVGLSEQVAKIEKLLEKVDKPEELPYYGEFVFYQTHMYLFLQQDIEKGYELLKLAMKLVPESQSELRGRTELLFSLAAQMHGKYKKVYQDVLKRDVGVNVDPILRSRRFLAMMWLPIIAAELDKAGLHNIHALELTRENKLVDVTAWCLYLSSIIYMNKGEWQQAIPQLEELLDMKYCWYTMAAVDGMVALIMTYQLTNQTDKAMNLLKDLEEYVNDLNPFYQQFLWAAKARYYTLTGDHESLKNIIGNQQIISLGNPQCYFDIPVHTECRALIFEGSAPNLKLAEEKLLGLIAISEGQHNILHWIELLVYQAVLYEKQERSEESADSLLKAVALAEPGKVKACFVEMGKPIMEILEKMPDEKKEHAYLHELIDTISSTPFHQMESSVTKPIIKEKLNLLTQRELEVLHCIAEGLRNQEIAAKLYNSEETIKKHIYNMFIKMNVKNRLSLVTKAREEGILYTTD